MTTRKKFTIVGAVFAIAACTPQMNSVSPVDLSARPAAIQSDISYLASEALAGRLTGTPGNDSAAAYIARRYAALRLRPMSDGYLQRFVARPPSHAGPSPSLPTQNVFAVLPGRDLALRGE